MTVYDDLELVRAFVCIVESGSISAGARNLRVTQPTLSRQLRTLEEKCGMVLLHRDTHRMHLSQAGHQLLADARSILALVDEAEQRLRSDRTSLAGNIRVFATIDFGSTVVSRLVAAFIQANPAVTVDLAYSNRPMRMLEEGCDVGIVAGGLADDSVVARKLGDVRRFPVATPEVVERLGAPRDPADLKSWPWINLAGQQFFGGYEVALVNGDDTQTITIAPVMLTEGILSIREAVRSSLGVAVLPQWLIAEDLVAGRMIRVLPEWHALPLPIHLIFHVQRHLPTRVRAFIDFATAYVATILS